MKKNSFLLAFSFCALTTANAQVLDNQVESVIVKNIVSFHFRYALEYDLNLNSAGMLLSDDKLFFTELWPTKESTLKIEVSETNLTYPNLNYKIYSILKKGFRIGNDSISTFRVLSSLAADDCYLVAYYKEKSKIKFLSGNFFKSLISGDFDLTIQRPESFYDYLKIRFYNFRCTDIKFKYIKKDKVYFSAYSQSLKEDVLLMVGKENFDLVSAKTSKGKVTY